MSKALQKLLRSFITPPPLPPRSKARQLADEAVPVATDVQRLHTAPKAGDPGVTVTTRQGGIEELPTSIPGERTPPLPPTRLPGADAGLGEGLRHKEQQQWILNKLQVEYINSSPAQRRILLDKLDNESLDKLVQGLSHGSDNPAYTRLLKEAAATRATRAAQGLSSSVSNTPAPPPGPPTLKDITNERIKRLKKMDAGEDYGWGGASNF